MTASRVRDSFILGGCALAFGAAATITQALMVREFFAVAAGVEASLGAVFASWLLAVGVGGAVGGRIRASRRALPLLLAGMSLAIPAEISGVRCARLAAGLAPGVLMPPPAVLWTAALFTLPVSFLVGLTFTTLCRADGRTGAVRRVYVAESLGSAAGGAAFTFLLAGRLPAMIIASVAGLALCAAALGLALGIRRRAAAALCTALIAGHAVAIANPRLLERPTSLLRWRSIAGSLPLLGEGDTKYQHVSVGGSRDQVSVYGNGHLLYAAPDPYTAAAAAHLALCQHPKPQRVLVIGGSPDIVRAMLDDPTVQHVTRVALDADLPAIVEKHAPGALYHPQPPRAREVFTDGRHFVASTAERFDLILVAVGDPSTALSNRYFTTDFCRAAKAILRPGGVFGTSVSSALDYIGADVASYGASVWRTLSKAFRHVAIVPGQTTHLFASDEPVVVEDPRAMAERYAEHGTKSEYFDGALFETLAPPGRSEFTRSRFEKAPQLPENTDARPVTYYLSATLWAKMAKGAASPQRAGGRIFLSIIRSARPRHFLVIPAAALLWGIPRRRRPHRSAVWAASATGACGMTLGITLLLAFQNTFGYLYAQVGILVGLFMLGLCGGGLAAGKLAAHPREALMAQAAALAAVVWPIAAAAASPWIIALLMGACGLMVGMAVPLAAELLQAAGLSTGRAAGAVEAADHIAASAGAALTATILFPLFGIAATCALAASLPASALILLWLGQVSARPDAAHPPELRRRFGRKAQPR